MLHGGIRVGQGWVVVFPSRLLGDERLLFIVPRVGGLSAAAQRASSALDSCPLLQPRGLLCSTTLKAHKAAKFVDLWEALCNMR